MVVLRMPFTWAAGALALIVAGGGSRLTVKGQAWNEADTSRLQIQIPRDLFKAEGYAHKEALFGIPVYGGFIAEKLYYNSTTNLCSAPAPEVTAQWKSPFILMVDRGDCTFVTKVRHAQHAGAAGVIVADHTCVCGDPHCIPNPGTECEHVEPIMADDGSGADITIPSFLVYKADADKIKEHISKNELVQVEMTWSLPSPDDRVEWTLWTSSNDTSSQGFKLEFRDMIQALGQHQYFTPFYQVYDGNTYQCTFYPDHCGSLCTNHGRYCMPDPDHDPYHGFSGRDIIIENLRQKCIWEYYGGESADKNQQGVGMPWWEYVGNFTNKCSVTGKFTDQACISSVMKQVGINEEKVNACMTGHGGVDGDNPNDILDKELAEKQKRSIVIVPSVYVNNVVQRGGLSANNVLSSICAGYLTGTQPPVCNCVNAPPDKVTKCVQSGSYVPDSMNGGTVVQSGVSVGSVVGIVAVVVLVMTGAGFVYWKRTQAQMREQVRSILAEYMPLEGNEIGDQDTFTNSRAVNGRYYDIQGNRTGGVQV